MENRFEEIIQYVVKRDKEMKNRKRRFSIFNKCFRENRVFINFRIDKNR